jgi:hypothetical protein
MTASSASSSRNANFYMRLPWGHASITTTGRYLPARPKESSSKFLPL